MEALDATIVERAGDWARAVTVDGSADVYGIDDPGAGLMFNHASHCFRLQR